MIRQLLHRQAKAFGRRYDYDVSYIHEMIETSPPAALRLSAYPLVSQYRGPRAGRGVWAGALFASVLDGDCGPCAQLMIDMAKEAGVDPALFKACVEGDFDRAGDLGLGFRFAQAAISGDLAVEELGREIGRRYGRRAVIAASFAAATGRFYPVLKRGLGHGAACERLNFGDAPVEIERAA